MELRADDVMSARDKRLIDAAALAKVLAVPLDCVTALLHAVTELATSTIAGLKGGSGGGLLGLG